VSSIWPATPRNLPAQGVDPTVLRPHGRSAPSTSTTKRNRIAETECLAHYQARDRNPSSRSTKSSEVQKGGIYPQIRETRAYCLGNVAKSGNSLLRSPQRRLPLLHRLACLRRPRGAAEHPSGSERLEPPGRRLVLRQGWRGNPEQARVGGVVGCWCRCSQVVSAAEPCGSCFRLTPVPIKYVDLNSAESPPGAGGARGLTRPSAAAAPAADRPRFLHPATPHPSGSR
jgi:hypothetical protein